MGLQAEELNLLDTRQRLNLGHQWQLYQLSDPRYEPCNLSMDKDEDHDEDHDEGDVECIV